MEKNKKGYYGYTVVVLMMVLMLPGSLIMSAAGIFYTPVTQELGVSLSSYGVNLTIIQLLCAFACPTLFTPLAKKFKMRGLLAVSLLLEGACFAVRAMGTNIWVFYLTSVVISLPMGLLFNVCIPIVANNWFPKNTGTAIGAMGCTQGLGGLLFSTLGGYLIGSVGWRNTFWVWAAICVIVVPFILIFMRNDPEEVGQVALGYEKIQNNAEQAVVHILPGMTKSQALKTSAFWICALAIALGGFAANVQAYINPYCLSVGMSSVVSGFVSGLIQAGVFVNKLVLGAICDKKDPKIGAYYYTATAVACFLIILFSGGNTVLVAIGCFLIGPIYAAGNLFGPVLMKYMFGPKDMSGVWSFGVLVLCTFGALGGTIWGIIVENMGYASTFIVGLAVVAVIFVLLMIAFGMRNSVVAKWEDTEGKANNS